MTSVTSAQIDEAAGALGVVTGNELFDGGQKRVLSANLHGEPCVMKVLSTSSVDPNAVRRAEREVELLQGLDSPHLVHMMSDLVVLSDAHPGAAWLEEFIDGEDLADLLNGSEWDWPAVARMMREVARGLDLTHRVGVIHRDLSPRNVRRRNDGTWVVLDFGFARHTLRSGLTVAGHPGTLGHLSPEHVNGAVSGPIPSSDVFAIGILGFQSLTQRLPIQGSTGEDYISHLIRCNTLDLRATRAGLPDLAYEVIERCLHPQPARRYRSGAELADALEGF